MMGQYKIYKLIDPFSMEVRYVGYTSKSLSERLKKHIHDSKKRFSRRDIWIRSLIVNGALPIIGFVCDCVDLNDALKKEVFYISAYPGLANSTAGGEKSQTYRPDVKAKISASRKGKMSGPDNPMFGKKRPDLSLRNKTVNPESVAKVSATLKVKYNTPEYRKILRDSQTTSRSVVQKTMDGKVVASFSSLREAGLNGFGRKEILRVSQGIYKQHKGYLWEVN